MEETKTKISKTMKGRKKSEETIKRMREAQRRYFQHRQGHWKGKHHSKKTKAILRQKRLGSKNPMFGKEPWNKGLTKKTDKRVMSYAEKLSKSVKRKWREDAEYVRKTLAGCSKRENRVEHTEKTKKLLRDMALKQWADPKKRQKLLKGFNYRPTRLEKEMMKIITDNLLPYTYVGDGSLWIGRMNPDFIHNGVKKVIEVYGDYPHRNDDPEDRINAFKKHGYDCLVIWGHELKQLSDREIAERISNWN